jgi:hypothetical protein
LILDESNKKQGKNVDIEMSAKAGYSTLGPAIAA